MMLSVPAENPQQAAVGFILLQLKKGGVAKGEGSVLKGARAHGDGMRRPRRNWGTSGTFYSKMKSSVSRTGTSPAGFR